MLKSHAWPHTTAAARTEAERSRGIYPNWTSTVIRRFSRRFWVLGFWVLGAGSDSESATSGVAEHCRNCQSFLRFHENARRLLMPPMAPTMLPKCAMAGAREHREVAAEPIMAGVELGLYEHSGGL